MAVAMIWGSPGSGKTVAATAPKNEKIKVLCSDNSSIVLNMFDRKNVTVERVEHWVDPGDGKNYFYKQFETARKSGKYTLIVVDNLSDIFDMAILDIEEQGKIKDIRQIYQSVYQGIKRLTREAANANCNVTFTAWDMGEDIIRQDGSAATRYGPNLPLKIRSQVVGLCNIVGQMAKAKNKQGEMQWFLITEDSETRYGCKDQIYGRKSCMPEYLFSNSNT
jgi:phage nucleotide-binding protein